MNGHPGAGTPSSSSRAGVDLFAASFLLLYYELVCIRWLPANIRVLGYFSNVVLISCFLGFGLGCILSRRGRLFAWYPALALFALLVAEALARKGVDNPSDPSQYLFGGGGAYSWLLAAPVVFVVNALPFVAIGQRLAALLDQLPPLRAYTINILGSLAGTLAFAAVSFLRLSPVAWFVLAAVAASWLLRREGRLALAVACVLFGAGAWRVHEQAKGAIWSAYYRITLQPAADRMLRLLVNHEYHQFVLDLSDDALAAAPSLAVWRITYDFPYRAAAQEGRSSWDVLVLGSGTGNDVAAALRHPVTHVDAVELDRTLYELGRKLHRERPYDSPRVNVRIGDAREYLRVAARKYDTIVLGWLDSHRLFSAMSGVRQDNFVYTVDSMRQARALLHDDGMLFLSFYVGKPWVGAKVFALLTAAFGHEPQVYMLPGKAYGEDGQIFAIGRSAGRTVTRPMAPFVEVTEIYRRGEPVAPPTDDWPYLYYKDRSLSREYVAVLGLLAVLSALALAPALLRGSFSLESAHFFFLGAGFLLLEVRNITLLALVYGSTWVVTSVVISAVLLMVVLANLLVERAPGYFTSNRVWLLLFASLALQLVWREDLVPLGPIGAGLLTTLVASSTFFFAGLVFARSFSRTSQASSALAFNVFGAVVGGLTEYLSVLVGLRGLSLLAVGFYAAAFLSARRGGTASAGSPVPTGA